MTRVGRSKSLRFTAAAETVKRSVGYGLVTEDISGNVHLRHLRHSRRDSSDSIPVITVIWKPDLNRFVEF